ncbi:MAG TPA: hypothetical protein ENI38_03260 [Candidatus Acetothermia bacterium]|nr:hypothetical protein [Candidatus Acetothermia bacterium]
MRRVGFWTYTFFLGLGAVLVGLVVGSLIDSLPAQASVLLLVIGALFLALASFLAKRNSRWWKTRSGP